MDLMKLSSYYYDLPKELIAQSPLEKRDSSRLLSFDKSEKTIRHGVFTDIESQLGEGDCLVLNDTRVIPARLYARSETHAGEIEVVLLTQEKGDKVVWKCLTRPGKKTRPGERLIFSDSLKGVVKEVVEEGLRLIEFECEGNFIEAIEQIGLMPLPPYITQKLEDKDRYQTVYAKTNGSAAAPTAGLHFTEELLDRLKAKGVTVAKVLLHVGLGTFRPVKEDDLSKHKMHSEYIKLTQETADLINGIKAKGGRVISVGTTSCRVLESVADENGFLRSYEGQTDIFIYPSYRFKLIDGLITNFHLPESTLIMLVSAFAGYEETMKIYREAVEQKYRFFSFGDACFFADRLK